MPVINSVPDDYEREHEVDGKIVRSEVVRLVGRPKDTVTEDQIKRYLSHFTDDMLESITVPQHYAINYAIRVLEDHLTTEDIKWMMTASTLLPLWRALRQHGYRLQRARKAIIFDVVDAAGVKRGEIGIVPATLYQRPGIVDLNRVDTWDLIKMGFFPKQRTQWPIT